MAQNTNDVYNRLFGSVYNTVLLHETTANVDTVILSITIKSIIKSIRDDDVMMIDRHYNEIIKNRNLFILPTLPGDNSFLLKSLFTSFIPKWNLSMVASIRLASMTQSTNIDLFANALLSSVLHYFTHKERNFSLEIVPIILQTMKQVSEIKDFKIDNKKLQFLPYVKREYFCNKTINGFDTFCICLDFIREYIRELRKIMNGLLQEDGSISLEELKPLSKALFNKTMRNIDDFKLSDEQNAYDNHVVIKCIVAGIIGSAFGIGFISTPTKISDDMNAKLTNLIVTCKL